VCAVANLTAGFVMQMRTTASEVSNGFGVLAPFLVLDAYQVVSLVLARATLSPLGYVLGGLKVAEAGAFERTAANRRRRGNVRYIPWTL